MTKALKAVVFDWAGTMVDHGSRAPMGVFVETFSSFGVEIGIEEAREPMGLPKRDHIAALMRMPRIARAWAARHGSAPDEAAIDAVYAAFVPRNVEVVADYGQLVPGAVETVSRLRDRGLRIGSTTGYTRLIMERLLPVAAAQGYAPDNLVCAGDLSAGRPTPLMMYKCFLDLAVWPAAAVVKVDDTEPGILEGRAAGSWTVGVTLTGNHCGLGEDELATLAEPDREAIRRRVGAKLTAAGADYVIDGVAALVPVLDLILGRLARGERPG
jgi:phosphonoacetaldehyde hydrolase